MANAAIERAGVAGASRVGCLGASGRRIEEGGWQITTREGHFVALGPLVRVEKGFQLIAAIFALMDNGSSRPVGCHDAWRRARIVGVHRETSNTEKSSHHLEAC